MVNGILEDNFRSYSELSRSIKQAVDAALLVNLTGGLNLPSYGKMMVNAIEDIVNKKGLESLLPHVESLIEELFGRLAKTTYTLAEIEEKVKGAAMEGSDERDGKITFIIENGYSGNYRHLYIDTEDVKQASHTKYYLSLDDGVVKNVRIRDYSGRDAFDSSMSALEKFLFNLYAQKCTVVVKDDDADYLEPEWSKCD
jgi:hypothetical protein